jgi:hypothetical protein
LWQYFFGGEFMRGLDIRIKYAYGRVMEITDPEESEDFMAFNVLADANIMGYDDFNQGIDDCPAMFGDIPSLISAWEDGWNSAAEMRVMSACDDCHNDRGDPCPIHG